MRAHRIVITALLASAWLGAGCSPEDLRYLNEHSRKGQWLEVKHEAALPPMPDADANAATLPGIDQNRNGVRDDIELWIVQTHGRDPQRAQALQRVAAAVQKTVSVGVGVADAYERGQKPESWLPAAQAAMRGNVMAGACVVAVFGAYEDDSPERARAQAARGAIEAVAQRVLDTDERRLSYQIVERLASDGGEFIKPLDAALNPCQ